jgi:hypothetical protein
VRRVEQFGRIHCGRGPNVKRLEPGGRRRTDDNHCEHGVRPAAHGRTGPQVNIVNNDSVEHSVTSQIAGAFDVHVDGGKNKTLTAPTEPGQYQFYCVYHPSMKGMLIVT